MQQTNRSWLPAYCDPQAYLPAVQETIVLFQRPPFLFQDFVGLAFAFLQTEQARDLGYCYDPDKILPCKWKCADESLFGVDLCLYAYTGHYPFEKGSIGGSFNTKSLGAAVHHSELNVDFGGTHVGYRPDAPSEEKFGHIGRPLHELEQSSNCGYLMGILGPFREVYDDACRNIRLCRPMGCDDVLAVIPNEFLQPSWSSHSIKLLVDLERLTTGPVAYDVAKPHTHKIAGRSLFYVSEEFMEQLSTECATAFSTPKGTPIGRELTADFFNIFDTNAELIGGVPQLRFLPYMKFILSSRVAPYPLKAAVTHANIEHNRLVDCIRSEAYRPYSFASFTGVFIDMYDAKIDAYVNLFQPLGVCIKAAGKIREVEFSSSEIHEIFTNLKPATPTLPLEDVLGYPRPGHVLDNFTFPRS